MIVDDINKVFAELANFVDETDDKQSPKELAAITAGLMLARIIVTDMRRIADAQEAMSKAYCDVVERARTDTVQFTQS